MSNHESDDEVAKSASVAQLRLRKVPFLTLPSETGETIKFYMFSPEDEARREFCLWVIVEEASGEIVRFLDLNMTERDMRRIVHIFQAKMFLWDESATEVYGRLRIVNGEE